MSTDAGIVATYQFDREPVWALVKGRKSVFLDTNVWIDMADGKKAEAQPIKDMLLEQVRSGALFCPLSSPLIWELLKQDYSKIRTGQLMEELSLNVCFAPATEIFRWEVESFAKRLAGVDDGECSRKMLFVPVVGYLASSFSLSCQQGTGQDGVRELGSLLRRQLSSLSLTDLLQLRDQSVSDFLKALPPTLYQKQAEFIRGFAKGDRGKVQRIEEQMIFQRLIMPAIERLPVALMKPLLEFGMTVPRDEYDGCLGRLLAELPALQNYVEVMALASADPNRKDRQADFFDLDMLPVPLAYAHVFVSQDRRIRDLLNNRGELLTRSTCFYCSDLGQLDRWLTS